VLCRLFSANSNIDFDEWIEGVLGNNMFRGKSYLRFARYKSYARLWQVSTIVGALEMYCKQHQKPPESCHVLDVGAGLGNITITLSALGFYVTGVDVDREATLQANRRKNGQKKAEFVLSHDLKAFKQTEVFDAIICSHVLEHLEDPETFLRIAIRSLVPGGLFLVIVPNGFGLGEFFRECIAFARRMRLLCSYSSQKISQEHHGSKHVQHFTMWRLNRLIGKHMNFKLLSRLSYVSGLPVVERYPFSLLDLRIVELLPRFVADIWMVEGIKPPLSK